MARLVEQKLVKRRVDELTLHPANPRQGDVGEIARSLEANGWYGAVIVQKSSGFVLAGNHRVLAARGVGLVSVPVFEVDVDDETARRIMLVDNRSAELASYDDGLLVELVRAAAEAVGGLEGTGWDGDDLDALIKAAGEASGPIEVDPASELDHKCPACGYEWSGPSR